MCENCSDLMKLPGVTTSVVNGTNGANAYVYIASASSNTGTNFTYPAVLDAPGTTNGRFWLASKSTSYIITTPTASDFTNWQRVVGTDGIIGSNGINGDISFEYKFRTGFAPTPAQGELKIDSGITVLSINSLDTNSVDISNAILASLSSTSAPANPILGTLKLSHKTNPSIVHVYSITNRTNFPGSHVLLYITAVTTSGSFSDNDNVVISFSRTGEHGATGATGSTGATGTAGSDGKGYYATSSTSLNIVTGVTPTIVTQSNLAYLPGMRVRLRESGGSYMEGICTSYSGTNLVVNIDYINGSGTSSSWNIGLTGDPGASILRRTNSSNIVLSSATTGNTTLTITGGVMPIGFYIQNVSGNTSTSTTLTIQVNDALSSSVPFAESIFTTDIGGAIATPGVEFKIMEKHGVTGMSSSGLYKITVTTDVACTVTYQVRAVYMSDINNLPKP